MTFKSDCTYYNPLDYWAGGILVECKKTKEYIEKCPNQCKDYNKNLNFINDTICLDIEKGETIYNCKNCKKICDDKYYFENKGIKYKPLEEE